MPRHQKEEQLQQAGRRKLEEEVVDAVVEHGKRAFGKACGRLVPFGAQVVASIAAYNVGVTAAQLVGFICKVSCATPVLGTCVGVLGVGFANALAGQASRHAHKLVSTGGNPLKPGFWEPAELDDVMLDAVLGVCIFKTLGGRFSSLMPSDLSKPGALAFESIPARPENSEAYAKPSVKRELARIFKRDGCHHCGSTRGPVIGDHMPPNKLVGDKDKLSALVQDLPGVAKVRELIGLAGRTGKPLQRFYPQCQKCSIKQATAMRNGKRVLVLHLHAPRYRSEHLSGVFVGIRHNVPPVDFPPAAPPEPRRRSQVMKWSPLALTAAVPDDETAQEHDKLKAYNSSDSSNAAGPQLVVQELAPVSWELGMQANAPPLTGTQTSRSPQQPQHTQMMPQAQHISHRGQDAYKEGRSAEHRPARHLGRVKPDILVQKMQGIAEQPPRDTQGPAVMVTVIPELYKQRADAAFGRHFAGQLGGH